MILELASEKSCDNSVTYLFTPRYLAMLQALQGHRGVQVSDTKRGPKSPKFPPKIGLLRWIFDIHLPDTLHTPTNGAPNISMNDAERM